MSNTGNLFQAKLIEKFDGDFQTLTDGKKHDFARAFADFYLINFFNKEWNDPSPG